MPTWNCVVRLKQISLHPNLNEKVMTFLILSALSAYLRLYWSNFSLVMLRLVFFFVITSSTMASRSELEAALCMEPLLEP